MAVNWVVPKVVRMVGAMVDHWVVYWADATVDLLVVLTVA